MKQTASRDVVRVKVRELLARSASFQALPTDGQRDITQSTVTVAETLTGDATLHPVDFPAFVSDLINGTFEAIVDASIQQMEAYGELIRDVAKTVDAFASENVDDRAAFTYLRDNAIDPDADRWPEAVRGLLLPAAHAEVAKSRQQLLATMVLMGVNRVMERRYDDEG